MVVERCHQWLHLAEQLFAARERERADDTNRGQLAAVREQSEQQRADRVRPALVNPITSDDAIGGPLMLDLEHHPLVGLVGAIERLGDDPVQSSAFESLEPFAGDCRITGGRRHVNRRPRPCERDLQRHPPVDERSPGQVGVAQRQQIESDKRGRGLLSQQAHA